MSHELFHILTHLGIHLVRHLTEERHPSPTGCRKCQKTTDPMYTTNCCKAPLCTSCRPGYERECTRVCSFCRQNVRRT